jgi:hypothetical protein
LTDPARLDVWVRGIDLRLPVRKAGIDDAERVLAFREYVNNANRVASHYARALRHKTELAPEENNR